jgi:poly-gamma-glutamate synthesis protein (capsule biosynthesis protein)
MLYAGAYQSFEDQSQIRVIEKKGIRVAFLAYTYGTNGIQVPAGKEYLVNLIDKEKIKTEIDRAEEIADVVVLSLHFGNEYERMPNQSQQELVQFAVDEGADIILGTHPHVLQPVSWVEGKEGNKAFVIYSLGNFISGQDELYRQIGGIASIEIKKVTDRDRVEITLQSPKFMPTYVNYHSWRDFKIIPMYQLDSNMLQNVEAYYREIKNHMSQWVPELVFIEGPM